MFRKTARLTNTDKLYDITIKCNGYSKTLQIGDSMEEEVIPADQSGFSSDLSYSVAVSWIDQYGRESMTSYDYTIEFEGAGSSGSYSFDEIQISSTYYSEITLDNDEYEFTLRPLHLCAWKNAEYNAIIYTINNTPETYSTICDNSGENIKLDVNHETAYITETTSQYIKWHAYSSGYDIPGTSTSSEIGDYVYTRDHSLDLVYNSTTDLYESKSVYFVELINSNAFTNNQSIISVNLNNISWVNNNMDNSFRNCYSLKSVTNINPNVTDMSRTFQKCNSMTDAPIIPNGVVNMTQTFLSCSELVNAPNIPNSVVNIRGIFYNCISLQNAPEIPSGVQDMYTSFWYCHSLINAPTIPNSVTTLIECFRTCNSLVNPPDLSNATNLVDMGSTFRSCSLLSTPPTIPNSVTRLSTTFMFCNSLTTAPVIPGGVTSLTDTFYNCNSLTTAPNIPSAVTDLVRAFDGCTSLTGNVYIHSEVVLNANQCFNHTSLTKYVYIPFYNNSVQTETYNAFLAEGYTTSGTKNGVYLKDLNEILYGVNDQEYQITQNGTEITLVNYIGAATDVVVPRSKS